MTVSAPESVPADPGPDCRRSPVPGQPDLHYAVGEETLEDDRFGEIRYRCLGGDHPTTIVALGGISADCRVDAWWSPLVGTGRAVDPNRLRVVSVDWIVPRTVDEPATTAIQADALTAVIDHLGIDRVDVFVGASFGAMVGLAFAARRPDRIGRLVAISGAHRSTPSATAGRVLQRAIVTAGLHRGDAVGGVALARALALTRYRPDALYDRRFDDDDPTARIHALEGYLNVNGMRFARGFDARRYLALSTALDLHQVDPAAVRCPVDLIGAESDRLVPLAQLRMLREAIGSNARLIVIESGFGHDAFLKSTDQIAPRLAEAIEMATRGAA